MYNWDCSNVGLNNSSIIWETMMSEIGLILLTGAFSILAMGIIIALNLILTKE